MRSRKMKQSENIFLRENWKHDTAKQQTRSAAHEKHSIIDRQWTGIE